MKTKIEIVEEKPFEDGVQLGKTKGKKELLKEINEILKSKYLKDTVGQMGWGEIEQYVISKLETPPNYTKYPELEDIYPERVDYIRGLAQGAECNVKIAAMWHYLKYKKEITTWWKMLNEPENEHGTYSENGCSGVLMIGPDGILGGQSAESLPPVKKPKGYVPKKPAPWGLTKFLKPTYPEKLVLKKPRTGYITNWGIQNEKGVGCFCGVSCSVWLDEPIEDVWPVNGVPLLRFAYNIERLIELYQRYTLHNWGRGSQIWADCTGNAIVVEKSFRRIGIRRIANEKVLWCTEGHWESPEMNAYIRQKRLEYLQKFGKHLGSIDMQYAYDSAVRFAHIGSLCHLPLKRDLKHMSRVLSDHAPFPRAVCRHGYIDTAPYDQTVTQISVFYNLSTNTRYYREWIPWKKFPCELPWQVTKYPPIPS